MKKRILTVLLAVCLVFALSTVSALAAEADWISDIENAQSGETVKVELTADVTLTESITIPSGVTVNIDGKGNTISYGFNGNTGVKAAFTGAAANGNLEGVPSGVKLNVKNVKFENTNSGNGSQGYAVLVGSNSFDTVITLTDCEFNGLYCGVLSNGVFAEPGEGHEYPVINIIDGTFVDTTYGTSIDTTTEGAIANGTKVDFSGNTGIENETETWDIVVASVTHGGVTKNYKSLNAAITAAADGDTVTLVDNTTCGSHVYINSNITLDLNGNTLTSTADYSLLVGVGKSFEIQNGTLNNTVGTGVFGFAGSEITIESDANIVAEGAGVMGSNNNADEGNVTFNIYGTIDSNDIGVWGQGPNNIMNIVGATINSNYFGVYQNGSYGGCEVTIKDSTVVDTFGNGVYISNNKTNSNDSSQGMQTLTIENSSITGPTAVEAKYTNVTIKGENTVLTATGDPPDQTLNNNGSVSTGYALAITHNGTSTSADGAGGSAIVFEGTFIGLIGIQSPTGGTTPTSEMTISGGNFSEPVLDEYLDAGLTAELYSRSNPEAPYSYYPTVEDALEAAQPGDIVTDLANVTSDTFYDVTFKYSDTDSEVVSVRGNGTVNLPAPTRSGYEFRGWRGSDGKLYKANAEYTVKGDVTFTAVWDAIDIPDTYPINVADAANGEVSTSLTNASRGSVITITATPDAGYSVGSVSVTGPDGRVDVKRVNSTTYTFVMPEGEVTVRVTFTTGLPFTDVSANQWFYEAVSYVYTNGMMEGDSSTTFNPDGQMTRAMVWVILARIDGETVTGANWIDTARAWAMAEGVSDGTDPNGLVTREQFATMLWRYAVAKGYDVSIGESTNILSYADFASISEYAIPAMQWACGSGIVTGVTDSTLVPQGTATRAQCAAIFMRYDQM